VGSPSTSIIIEVVIYNIGPFKLFQAFQGHGLSNFPDLPLNSKMAVSAKICPRSDHCLLLTSRSKEWSVAWEAKFGRDYPKAVPFFLQPSFFSSFTFIVPFKTSSKQALYSLLFGAIFQGLQMTQKACLASPNPLLIPYNDYPDLHGPSRGCHWADFHYSGGVPILVGLLKLQLKPYLDIFFTDLLFENTGLVWRVIRLDSNTSHPFIGEKSDRSSGPFVIRILHYRANQRSPE